MIEKQYNSTNQLYIIEKDGKYGFISKKGKEISPPIFDFYHIYQGFAVVRKDNQVGNLFFHEGLKEPLTYRTVEAFEVIRGGKYGVDSNDGKELIPCKYDFVKIYYKIVVCQLDNRYYLFNIKGESVIDMAFQDVNFALYQNYQHLNPLNSSLRELTVSRGISVMANDKWGVISQNGRWIVQPSAKKADDIELFQHAQLHFGKYYIVKNENGKKGVVNMYGGQVVPCLYDDIIVDNQKVTDNSRGFIVKTEGKYGLYSHYGKLILSCTYDWINYIIDDVYMVTQGETQTVLNLRKILNSEWAKVEEIDSSCVDFHSFRSDALLSIGMSFYHDICFPQYQPCAENKITSEIQNAIKWYLLATQCGNFIALTACYNIYKYGIGVEANTDFTDKYLEQLKNYGVF